MSDDRTRTSFRRSFSGVLKELGRGNSSGGCKTEEKGMGIIPVFETGLPPASPSKIEEKR